MKSSDTNQPTKDYINPAQHDKTNDLIHPYLVLSKTKSVTSYDLVSIPGQIRICQKTDET